MVQRNPVDFGPKPYVVNIKEATNHNPYYRRALWTGHHLQLTLMSIPPGGEIGLEVHPHLDQFLRIESGYGLMLMGSSQQKLTYKHYVSDDFAIFVPAGTWHNLVNNGKQPIKLYSIYAPPPHPFATVQKTKAEADAAENEHH